MLLALRERISGYIAWFIVILISVPFVLWGIQEYLGLGQDSYALEVNDSKVSLAEFDQILSGNRQMLLRSFGGRVPEYFDAEAFLRKQTLDQLINRELLKSVIAKYNYRVSAGELAGVIMKDSRFLSDGEFNPDIYAAELESRGLSKQFYEQSLADQVLMTQIQQGVQTTAFVSEQELRDLAKLRYQVRDFDHISLPIAAYKDTISVSENEIQAYYDDNKDELKTEQQISVRYLELSLAELARQIPVSEEVLLEEYEQAIKSGRYQTEEIRDASHILIRVPDDADDAALLKKRIEIEGLLARIRQGEDFNELAKSESDDPGSASQGGALGEVRRGVMVKPFEETLFALEKAGDLSEPVKTRFGFHIIKLNSVKPSELKPFAEVKDALQREYQSKEAETAFYDKVDVLATMSFEHPDDIKVIAEATGLEVKESGLFTRVSGSGVANYPEVREVAFSDNVLLEERNSDLIEVADNHVVVLRLEENKPSRTQTLEEASAAIQAKLKQQKAGEVIGKAADSVQEELAAGGQAQDLSKLAKQHKGEYKAAAAVTRDSQEVQQAVVQAVFRIPADRIKDKPIEEVVLSNGDIVVVRLNNVKDGDIDSLSEDERSEYAKRIAESRGRAGYSMMVASLKEQADIKINPEIDSSESAAAN